MENNNFRIELIVNYLKQLKDYEYTEEFVRIYNENKESLFRMAEADKFKVSVKAKFDEVCAYEQALAAKINL